MVDGELQGQLSRFAGFDGQVRIFAVYAVDQEAQQGLLATVRCGSAGFRCSVREMRLWRNIYIQPLQLHNGNPDGLARFETQLRVKPELGQLDERPNDWFRRARSIRYGNGH